jgi:hypothetical protein
VNQEFFSEEPGVIYNTRDCLQKLFFCFLTVIFISGCKPEVPKDVLPPKKMQAVLWDVLRADDMANVYALSDTSFYSFQKHAPYYRTILEVHSITKKDFVNSLEYYKSHPVLLKKILDSIQVVAERERVRVESKSKIVPTKIDSIKNNIPMGMTDSQKKRIREGFDSVKKTKRFIKKR